MTRTTKDPDIAARVAEAKAIKSERDRVEQERIEREEAARAEAARVRAAKIAAGLLGVCPQCGYLVDAAEGIVLSHTDRRSRAVGSGSPDCCGIGEDALEADREQPGGFPLTYRAVVRLA